MREEADAAGGGEGDGDWRDAPTPEDQRRRFTALVLAVVREVLGFGARAIDTGLTLGDIGADSLLALQLVRALERRLDVRIADLRGLQARSLEDLIDVLFERARGEAAA
jgi:acyl carrier protein